MLGLYTAYIPNCGDFFTVSLVFSFGSKPQLKSLDQADQKEYIEYLMFASAKTISDCFYDML